MVLIKVCGLTNAEDIDSAVEAQVDIIGLVFVPGSKRELSFDEAKELSQRIPASVSIAGVFSNQPLSHVREATLHCRLDIVQLHGAEPPSYCNAIDHTIWKRFHPNNLGWRNNYPDCRLLIDPGAGSGCSFNWDNLDIPVSDAVLAGGLTADTVGPLVEQKKPYAVDVSSGVECAGGKKSRQAMIAFAKAARDAYQFSTGNSFNAKEVTSIPPVKFL